LCALVTIVDLGQCEPWWAVNDQIIYVPRRAAAGALPEVLAILSDISATLTEGGVLCWCGEPVNLPPELTTVRRPSVSEAVSRGA
jgi:hypothetical protein